MPRFYSRVHPRRKSYDYRQPGSYFVTVLTHGRQPILGKLTSGGVVLTHCGEIVQRYLGAVADRFPRVTVDTFIVMPDHVHAIIILSATSDESVTLSQVIGWIKQRVSRDIHLLDDEHTTIWHRSFHDRIIRDSTAFLRVRDYIIANPARALQRSMATIGRSRW